MPFGLCNTPATFQRLMDLNILILLVYLNDIIVYSKTITEHLERLELLFCLLAAANLKLKPSKCFLLQKKVVFLGHVISDKSLGTEDDKIERVRDWATPKSATNIRGFLGLCSYYRRFVRGFTGIASSLHTLTHTNVRFSWSDERQIAFDTLKGALSSAPILGHLIGDAPYLLDTDASLEIIGAVLSQIQDGQYCVTRR